MNDFMSNPMLTPILLFLGSIFLSRAVEQKGLEVLSADKKLNLPKLLYKQRLYGMFFLIGLVILMFVLNNGKFLSSITSLSIYFGVLLVYYYAIAFLGQKTLKENNYPHEYVRNFLLVNLIRFLGLAGFFVMLYKNKVLLSE